MQSGGQHSKLNTANMGPVQSRGQDRKSRKKRLPQADSQTQDAQKDILFCCKNTLIVVCWKRNFICSFDLLFLWAALFPFEFRTAPCQQSWVSDLSEITNTFSFALIWLKSDECVPGRLRNAVWNCTWGSGFSGRKEIYEEVLGDGAAVVCGWLSLSFSPLSP